jgi:hypothetical protein
MSRCAVVRFPACAALRPFNRDFAQQKLAICCDLLIWRKSRWLDWYLLNMSRAGFGDISGRVLYAED